MFAVVAAAGAASPEVGSVWMSAPAEKPLIAHFVRVCAVPGPGSGALPELCSARPGNALPAAALLLLGSVCAADPAGQSRLAGDGHGGMEHEQDMH